ncbi:ArsR/SmtB family transcription factor [Naumannella huperziae]
MSAPAPDPLSPDIAPIAALFADRSRARLLSALLDGRRLPASRLAAEAGVSASTVSGHLARLTAAGVVEVEASGRFRFYRLAGPEVARVIESLSVLAGLPPVASLRGHTRAARLRAARTCYDHLAGRLGTAVLAALVRDGALVRTDGTDGLERAPGERLSAVVAKAPWALGPRAEQGFRRWGVDLPVVCAARREPIRSCLDWTEQRHHLGGGLGAALLDAVRGRGWIASGPRPREVVITESGEGALTELLGELS